MKNKISYFFIFIILISLSCNKIDGFTSSGVEIISPSGDEDYLNFPSDSIFNPNILPRFDINLPNNALEYLNSDPTAEEYVEGSLTYNGETLSPIGIRYKGSIGAFVGGVSGEDWANPSGYKTATKLSMKFKIDWKGYNSSFYNLKTIQLHSMNLDPSQLHDRLGYWLFREMGVPAPRSIHVKLYINGVYNGLFSMVEQIDKQFTNYNYSDGSGNLYKEVWPLKSSGELQSDKKIYKGLVTNRIAGVNHSIIKTFAENIISSSIENLQEVLSNHLDIDQHIALAVVDRTIRNDDGPFHWYCSWGNCEPHNFYWYENPSSRKVHLIPWDLDNAFENIISNANPVTPIADRWGDTTNNCQPFEYGEMGIQQKSAACDKIIAGLALDQSKYEELKTILFTGPMSEGIVNNKIDQWAAQIRDATEEAQLLYEDAITVNEWENEIIKLKNQLDHARNN